MSNWIDFKELRAQLDFEQVLRHYGVEIKARGEQHHGFCPLPDHNGKRNSPSFSANLKRGIFQCFGCQAKGNVLEFAALMEKIDPNDGAALRKVAIVLRDKFCPGLGGRAAKSEKPQAKKSEPEREQNEPEKIGDDPTEQIVVNAPLDFELKQLDYKHSYLDKRGFTAETIERFGLGYCSKGLLAGRIAIPVHDLEAKLIGYCGRVVDDTLISEDNPRYKFPPKRERKEVVYEFHKSELLYNVHRLKAPVDDLIVVEGFTSVWWLTQMGFPHVVASMGSSTSSEQAAIVERVTSPSGRVWAIPDGDAAGRKWAVSVLEHLAPSRSLRLIKLDEGKQPTDYPGGWFGERMGR